MSVRSVRRTVPVTSIVSVGQEVTYSSLWSRAGGGANPAGEGEREGGGEGERGEEEGGGTAVNAAEMGCVKKEEGEEAPEAPLSAGESLISSPSPPPSSSSPSSIPPIPLGMISSYFTIFLNGSLPPLGDLGEDPGFRRWERGVERRRAVREAVTEGSSVSESQSSKVPAVEERTAETAAQVYGFLTLLHSLPTSPGLTSTSITLPPLSSLTV